MVKKAKPVKKAKKSAARPKKLKAAKSSKNAPVQRRVDPLIAAMGKELRSDNKSLMFKEEPLDMSKSKLVKLDEEAREDSLKSYYKNLVLRCTKCDGRFDHEATLPPVEYELKCPHCNDVHIMRFTPTSKLFTVHSKTIDVLDSK